MRPFATIANLMDRETCLTWIREYFHQDGLKCPHCGADLKDAYWFRRTKRSQLDVYRCQQCEGIYNLYSDTLFKGRYFRPEQTVRFIKGVSQDKPTAQLAREVGISRMTAMVVRQELQAYVERVQSKVPIL